jgi:hypothetical protein
MHRNVVHGLLSVLGLLGFAVLMALRSEPGGFGVRVVVAALAGACLGFALVEIRKVAPRS